MTSTKNKPLLGACPDCDADVVFTKAPYLGQKKTCPECQSELEVIGLTPLELDWAYEYDDYDDDDFEFDEEDY